MLTVSNGDSPPAEWIQWEENQGIPFKEHGMSSTSRSNMEAYLRQMGDIKIPNDFKELETEYLCQIYRLLPREKALTMPLKQARAKTAILK